jgi:hypothetical protein
MLSNLRTEDRVAHSIWLGILGSTILVTALPAQAPLKPGAESCDQALHHASRAVLQVKRNLIAQAEPAQDGMVLFERTIVQATDVVLHCEPPADHPTMVRMITVEQLEADLAHLFEARRANLPTNPGDSAETPKLELSVGVITPLGSPTNRVVEYQIGYQGKDRHVRLIYAPNPKRATVITNNGQRLPTDMPDGFVRISGPDSTITN